jgi:Ras-related C3 botulinum toxin substrate 1
MSPVVVSTKLDLRENKETKESLGQKKLASIEVRQVVIVTREIKTQKDFGLECSALTQRN